jgi:hypothetical protein
MKLPRHLAFTALLVVCLTGISSGEEQGGKKPCREHPMLSGPCYRVRGRMSLYNGTPSVRIWPVGTRRMLGVSESRFYLEGYANLPPDLVRQLTWDNAIFADFTVCPFAGDRPGRMRFVCVESAEKVEVRERMYHCSGP